MLDTCQEYDSCKLVSSIDKLSGLEIIDLRNNPKINSEIFYQLKEITSFNNSDLSELFEISEKTFRSYLNKKTEPPKSQKEKAIMLLALICKGLEVFGKREIFLEWLDKPNFYLDGKKPLNLLDSIAGIRMIEERLISLEYGDNV